jgi:hypothetical protein
MAKGDTVFTLDVQKVAPHVRAAVVELQPLRGHDLAGALAMLLWAVGGDRAPELLRQCGEILPQLSEHLQKAANDRG